MARILRVVFVLASILVDEVIEDGSSAFSDFLGWEGKGLLIGPADDFLRVALHESDEDGERVNPFFS